LRVRFSHLKHAQPPRCSRHKQRKEGKAQAEEGRRGMHKRKKEVEHKRREEGEHKRRTDGENNKHDAGFGVAIAIAILIIVS
jgi:hypothetical protein